MTEYHRNPDVLWSAVEEDVVALNVDRGLCFAMPDVTAAIWQRLATPHSLDALVDSLREEYDIGRTECRADVADILAERGLPFVFMTGYGKAGLRESDRGRPVLQKPYNLERLVEIMTQWR